MKIEGGNYRMVIVFHNYVIKLPYPSLFLKILKRLPKGILLKRRGVGNDFKWAWLRFKKAVQNNISEYSCWRQTRAKFLAPTKICLGLINVQEREAGEVPSWEEVESILRRLSKGARRDVWTMDGHYFEPHNFLKNGQGWRLLDYGDHSEGGLPLTTFIVRHQTELEQLFCSQNQPPAN